MGTIFNVYCFFYRRYNFLTGSYKFLTLYTLLLTKF